MAGGRIVCERGGMQLRLADMQFLKRNLPLGEMSEEIDEGDIPLGAQRIDDLADASERPALPEIIKADDHRQPVRCAMGGNVVETAFQHILEGVIWLPQLRRHVAIVELQRPPEQLRVVAAKRDDHAIENLRASLEREPRVPGVVTIAAEIDGFDREPIRRLVQMVLGSRRQRLLRKNALAEDIGIADEGQPAQVDVAMPGGVRGAAAKNPHRISADRRIRAAARIFSAARMRARMEGWRERPAPANPERSSPPRSAAARRQGYAANRRST